MGKQAQHGLQLAALALASTLPAQDAHTSPKPRGNNAVDVYIMAIDEARRALSIKGNVMLNLPYEASAEGYASEFWCDKCRKTTVARTLFAQAARSKNCKFGIEPTGDSQLSRISPVLWQLRTLVFAHGMQNAENAPEIALSEAETLLFHARQLSRGPNTKALALGYLAEENAITLIGKTLAGAQHDPDVIARLRKNLERHQAMRVNRGQIADVAFAETLQRLKVVPGIINSKQTRLRIIDRLTKILVVVRNPDDETLGYQAMIPDRAASSWSAELQKIERPVPADDKLRKAYQKNLTLPAITGLGSLLNRHTMGQKKLNELLDKLPK